MKYIISHRFKTLLEVKNNVENIVSTCDAGRSSDLMPAIDSLRKTLAFLPPMKSEPFTKKQISTLERIEKEGNSLLNLPEDLGKIAKQLISNCDQLLKEIEPFLLEDGNKLPKEIQAVIAHVSNIQNHIELILQKIEEHKAIDAKDMEPIQTHLKELTNTSHAMQDGKAKNVLKEFIGIWELYEESWGGLEFQILHQSCEYLIRFFTHGDELSEDELALVTILQNLEALYQKARPNLKPNAKGEFLSLFQDAEVEKQVKMLEDFEFEESELTKMRDTIMLSYSQGVKENGRSEVSKSRAIECFQLFGETVKELLKLFEHGKS